ncbi:MAG TPA: hypothetical protein VGC80_00905, partial [Acetobacteraceae bacterium]
MDAAAEAGCAGAFLWVFAANRNALRFYDRLGGLAARREMEPVFGHPVDMIRYEWPQLERLASACRNA